MEGGSATSPLRVRELELDRQYGVEIAAEPRSFAADMHTGPAANAPLREDEVPTQGLYVRAGKRAFDLAFSAAFLLLIGLWLFPLVAIAIRVNSRGPVFFRQKRVGIDGQTFTCFKFRTMAHDPSAGFVQAQKNDCRITRVGALLRRTNLDEIPQFMNVLLGNMSVIGPRPHVPELDAVFKDVIPLYSLRNAVKPGVSGLAQVSGCRGETRSVREMNHRVRFDLFYCRNVSLALDAKLVLLTILRAVQGDEKAY
ncbi:MAG: sugar transferase [Solimonas sp.]